MTTLRKKIIIGASASTGRGRINAVGQATSNPPTAVQRRTLTVAAVKPTNARDMFYRDEVFNVTVTVTGTQACRLKLEFSKGETHQTLGSRGSVQMFDFENNGILHFPAVNTGEETERTKTLKAVINTAQIVRIKVTEINSPNQEPLAETDDIHIVHRLRQYTTAYGDPNVYDSYINKWVNYWDDWNIGDPVHTFMTDAAPSGDLVKAVTYKESNLSRIDSVTGEVNLNLMRVTEGALDAMTIEPPIERGEDRKRVTVRDANASGNGIVNPFMDYGTLNEGYTVNNYTVTDGPTNVTEDDSFKWGIRYLIAGRTKFTATLAVEIRDWWGPTGAVRWYNRQSGMEVSYPLSVEKLYAEGKYPHTESNAPDYLWPIKVDGSARDN